MTSPHRHAYVATLGLMLAALMLVPARADGAGGRSGPGWSNAPRWRLPAARPPECPQGYEGRRRLVQVANARCKETGPEGQVPARREPARPTPSPATRPTPAPAPAPSIERTPAPPVARAPAWTPAPTRDATAIMAMSEPRCLDYLREHEVEFVALDHREAPEVAMPVRLRGSIAGVVFTIPWTTDRDRDPHAIWDCRLVAATIPLAEWLHARGVTEVQYFSALRRGKIVKDKPKSQHNLGLALDLYALRRGGDPAVTVEEAYPRRTLRRCPRAGESGPGAAPSAAAPVADLYLGLVCFAVDAGLVHTLLTPDHDRAHANHLHLDVKAGQRSPVDPYVSFHGS